MLKVVGYQIYNVKTGEKQTYKSCQTANRVIDRRNAIYGGYLWYVRPVYEASGNES